ncbi:MAG TPA: PLD nuclease N-terminal domain-containing protein [Dehalococcoidales bacterium]|nr:PLD nuclease N-terminal domain-containing protein [Dehalococcoidales bacterium]
MPFELQSLLEIGPFLIPLILLQLGLLIYALIDVCKKERRVKGDNKLVWILVIVLVNLIGPIIYLALGRKEGPVDSDKD